MAGDTSFGRGIIRQTSSKLILVQSLLSSMDCGTFQKLLL